MNTQDSSPDDSHWSSLAHELGLDETPAPMAPQPTPVEVAHDHAPPHHHDLPDAADEEDTMLEPQLSGEPVSEAADGEGDEAVEEGGEPGEGGKRRRRRRRRRRKGGPEGAPAAAGEGAEGGEEPAEEGFPEEEPEPEPEQAAGETPSHVAMRDVIANWNVPSWDELIGGLYRPGT